MSQGDKTAYTAKQKHKAELIEKSYESRGVSVKEAESRAWATVYQQDGGGKLSGSGRAKSAKTTTKAATKIRAAVDGSR